MSSKIAAINYNGAEWFHIKEALEEELLGLREANEKKDVDPISTAFIRGRIAQLRDILSWEDRAKHRIAASNKR